MAGAIENKIKSIKQEYSPSEKGQTILIWLADGTCVGSKTLINDVVGTCGGKNLLAQQNMKGWQKIPREKRQRMHWPVMPFTWPIIYFY